MSHGWTSACDAHCAPRGDLADELANLILYTSLLSNYINNYLAKLCWRTRIKSSSERISGWAIHWVVQYSPTQWIRLILILILFDLLLLTTDRLRRRRHKGLSPLSRHVLRSAAG